MPAVDKRKALAMWAIAEHAAGVAEDPRGSNDGPPMKRYALYRETPLSWCSRMVRRGLLACGIICRQGDDADGDAVPVSIGELYDMAAAAALYRIALRHGGVRLDPADVRAGDLRFLLGRGDSDPLTSTEGQGGIHHVGIAVDDADASATVQVVDGNWADRVCRNLQPLADPVAIFVRFPPDP